MNQQVYRRKRNILYKYFPCLSLWFFVCVMQMPAVYAQTDGYRDIWYKGTLVLAEGDTLDGDIHYELQSDLVQINTDNTIKTYSARQIWSFQVYDPDMMTDRRFFALPYAVESSYKVPMLFELLTEGNVSLLAREKLVTENIPQYSYWSSSRYYTRTRLSNDFFFGFENGRIRRYDGSKRDFFYLIKEKSGDVKKFVSENRLRYSDKYDLIQIINYYNSIK
ncbi:hypothetical protein GXP67_10595 [Rhodocytophaga rosea]|uniref:Uncharacterized protein n=1 Tax=Rhodocytophaga rosea TaxID=2704465 RepID=A0A6C0GGW2_9BACT|nr:hypothetical protein [Rhodocytophaga rosea]QHT67064.1 hypothetical protein GXP67_10595 [Rhodocytophaga rosea]